MQKKNLKNYLKNINNKKTIMILPNYKKMKRMAEKRIKRTSKNRLKVWIPGHYTTKIVRGRKIRVWVPGYYRYL